MSAAGSEGSGLLGLGAGGGDAACYLLALSGLSFLLSLPLGVPSGPKGLRLGGRGLTLICPCPGEGPEATAVSEGPASRGP